MISIEKRMSAFTRLGLLLLDLGKGKKSCNEKDKDVLKSFLQLDDLVGNLTRYNGWFDETNVRRMMFSLGESLKEDKLAKWVGIYQPEISKEQEPKIIAVVMAGNIPAVGFHDFLMVLLTGNKLLAKLSSEDDKLMPAISELLITIEPGFQDLIHFTTHILNSFDAVIATGSNNTSRYFEYYFSKYPHIIRKNRNGIAIISGNETETDFDFLASDILDYYGLGCRNVSKIFVPEKYDFMKLLDAVAKRTELTENHKYYNNYEYNKAIFLVNGKQHKDTGNLLLTEDTAIASPISVLYFEPYSNIDDLKKMLANESEKIQCVVTKINGIKNSVAFGKSQRPELWDYADGVDTMDFLLNIS
jgi:hypothetical protein